MTKIILTLFTVYSLGILYLSYQANPRFFFIGDDYYQIIVKPPKAPATLVALLNSSCQAISQFRHDPKRQGALLTAQPSAQAKIVEHIYPINVGIHGASKASPAIDETGIYIGSDTGFFWKMDFSGKILWSFYAANSKNGFHGTAALDNKKAYIGAYDGFMYAFDKMTGKLSWANPVGDFVGASPLLADGALYISVETGNPNGLVTKLDCNTGETLWNSQWLGGHSHSSPTFDAENDLVLTGANSGRVYAFDNQTGDTRWELQVGGPIKGTLSIHKGVTYFGAWDKMYYAVETKTGEKLWRLPVGGRIQTSLTLVPELNLGITNTPVGKLVAIDLTSGEVQWSDEHGDKNHYFSVLVTGKKDSKGSLVWARCGESQLCVYDGKTGKKLNQLKLPGSFTGVPVAYKNRIYISLVDNHGLVVLE